MIKSTTWNIHKSDNSYVGQASGFCEQVAFSKCMSTTGMQIIEREIEAEGLPDGSTNISYGSENFFMSPQV